MVKLLSLTFCISLIICSGFGNSFAQRRDAEPKKLTLCQLQSDPAKYNHKLIEITGFVSHGFEDFTVSDPECPSARPVWLDYGGTRSSDTIFCCGVTASRTRPKQLVVEGVPVPLVKDVRFQQFDNLLQRRPDSVVHATVVGRFFAGKQVKYPAGTLWAGYGHMGFYSLLAIQQVKSVDRQDSADLDYGASVDQPDVGKVGCGYKILTGPADENAIGFQRMADSGERGWSFDDPQRVAVDGLSKLAQIDGNSITKMREISRAQGRLVYEWRPNPRGTIYMVVVSRPYVLSFYAKDAKRVAWVVAAAYEISCD